MLGLWLEQNEGAKFWLRVMNELRNRGTEDILLAVVDGLKGFPEAITALAYDRSPGSIIKRLAPRRRGSDPGLRRGRLCIVHLLRNSMDFVSWKDRKGLAAALKEVYRAPQRRGGRAGALGVRGRPLGHPLPGHRPELAARLGRGHPILRLS